MPIRDGKWVNLEDYYTDNGAFDEDGVERFVEALEQLMTVEEWEQFMMDEIMSLEEYAKALIKVFPSIFNCKTEFTFLPKEGILQCRNMDLIPSVKISDGYDLVFLGLVNNSYCLEWMDKYGSKEYRRLEKSVKEHVLDVDDDEEEYTFFVKE